MESCAVSTPLRFQVSPVPHYSGCHFCNCYPIDHFVTSVSSKIHVIFWTLGVYSGRILYSGNATLKVEIGQKYVSLGFLCSTTRFKETKIILEVLRLEPAII